MTDKYAQLQKNPKVSESLFGLKFGLLEKLLKKVQKAHEQYLEQNPLSKRGLDAGFSFENQFLLTLEYLRTYQTFEVLGFSYGISKSYANKTYHKMLTLLADVTGLQNPEQITRKQAAQVIVDVSCQPVERPVENQKPYYNRYKKTTLPKRN
jgi:hypothetical protein